MQFEPEVLAIVTGFMILANRLVAAIITPIFEKFNLDRFWLLYVSWVLSGVLVFLADVNLFMTIIPSPIIGKVLTSIVAGGGANILYDLTDKTTEMVITAEDES